MELKREKGFLERVIISNQVKGKIYVISDDLKRKGSVYIRFYQEGSEELAEKFEEETKSSGNEISIFRDGNTVFALRNSNGTIIFANGYFDDKKCEAYENSRYLKEIYNMTQEDLLRIINEQISIKKLELK